MCDDDDHQAPTRYLLLFRASPQLYSACFFSLDPTTAPILSITFVVPRLCTPSVAHSIYGFVHISLWPFIRVGSWCICFNFISMFCLYRTLLQLCIFLPIALHAVRCWSSVVLYSFCFFIHSFQPHTYFYRFLNIQWQHCERRIYSAR